MHRVLEGLYAWCVQNWLLQVQENELSGVGICRRAICASILLTGDVGGMRPAQFGLCQPRCTGTAVTGCTGPAEHMIQLQLSWLVLILVELAEVPLCVVDLIKPAPIKASMPASGWAVRASALLNAGRCRAAVMALSSKVWAAAKCMLPVVVARSTCTHKLVDYHTGRPKWTN